MGDAGNDTLLGGLGTDSLSGGTGDDTLYGGGDADTLWGEDGSDALYGDAGADTLSGGMGNDLLDGGADNDRFNFLPGDGTDTIVGGESGVDADVISFGGQTVLAPVTVVMSGTEAGSWSQGSGSGTFTQVENLWLTGGNDTFDGTAGGGTAVSAGGGDDRMTGGTGRDWLAGEAGNDSLFGGVGNDTLVGGTGNDFMDGGADNDRIVVMPGEGNDTIIGGESAGDADVLTFGLESVTTPVEVTMTGTESGTWSHGGGGGSFTQIESVWLTSGNDTFDGTAGSGSGVSGGGGADRMTGGTARDWFSGDDGSDTLVGGGGNDWISGGNDADSLQGDDGLDTLLGGAGNDTLFGGGDADSLNGGTGDDLLYGDAGLDTISTGGGEDTVHGGADADRILGEDGNDRLYGDAGMDTLQGGLGNDQLFGGSEADSLSGDAGDDRLYGGSNVDTIHGGDGNDTVDAGTEDDLVYGGAGADLVYGGEGRDTLLFGEGNDIVYGGGGDDFIDDEVGTLLAGRTLIYGGDGQDRIFTGFDADTVFGDAGGDTIEGEDGNDLLNGGTGADKVYGGAGRDTIALRDGDFAAGDFVDGGSNGDDFDVLDLSAYGWARTDIAYSSRDMQSGTVTFYDEAGSVLGTMDFVEIEQVVPCFSAGTLVDTPDGPRPVENIAPGDLVLTRDDGPLPVRWVGVRRLGLADLIADPNLHPVELAADAFGPGQPDRPVCVSPQHRVLFGGAACELYFGTDEVLVPAIQMVGQPGISQRLHPVTYVHLLFDRHQILRTHGIWSESFQPGERVLGGIPDPQRDELLRLFPELEVPGAYQAARITLKGYETRVLLSSKVFDPMV